MCAGAETLSSLASVTTVGDYRLAGEGASNASPSGRPAHLAVHDEGEELVADLADLKQPRPRADVALPDFVCAAGTAGAAGRASITRGRHGQ